ncbi:hypothetical protein [Comamonas sp. MYb396]|uniref:hypothetical protein n=1 Tax=Comamonas sp. MYb396 TaxID=2745302 RepID=UPI0030B4319E
MKQAQEALYHSITAIHGQIAHVKEMPARDRTNAMVELAGALLIILRAKPVSPLDTAADDSGYQRFKSKIVKLPRKNSKLWRELHG